MRTYFDCYPCFLRQALSAARRVGADDSQQFAVIQGVLALLQKIQPDLNPAEIADRVHRIVRDTGATNDPYREAKAKSTEDALALYPHLKRSVALCEDPLERAIRISIAGNIIDFRVSGQIEDLSFAVEKVINHPFYFDDTNLLGNELPNADYILFLADNAGETVFDRVLIETLPMPVVYAVKGAPILNDAIMEDAVAAGLDRCASLISNGTDAPGTIFSLCSNEFRRIYEAAPLSLPKVRLTMRL